MIKKLIVALLSLKGIGRKSIYKFLMENPKELEQANLSEDDLVRLIKKFANSNKKSSGLETVDIKNALYNAEELIQTHINQNVEIISIFDEYYPNNFLSLGNDAPIILYAKGDIELLKKEKFLAVIGSRNISEKTAKIGMRLSQLLAEQDEIIVSGLAIGSDTCGHLGALSANNGHTIAILPSGLDTITPSANKEIADNMVKAGSLLLSEYPIGTKADRGKFIERDRLQAGLSNGVVVLETSENGGTMHAVTTAYEQNKPIACLPGNMVEQTGNKMLIEKYSAVPLATKGDIEEFVKKVDSSINSNKSSRSCDTKETVADDKFEQISLF